MFLYISLNHVLIILYQLFIDFISRTDEKILPWDETKAICTGKYSEISPLQGGVVAFSPLKGDNCAIQGHRVGDPGVSMKFGYL